MIFFSNIFFSNSALRKTHFSNLRYEKECLVKNMDTKDYKQSSANQRKPTENKVDPSAKSKRLMNHPQRLNQEQAKNRQNNIGESILNIAQNLKNNWYAYFPLLKQKWFIG